MKKIVIAFLAGISLLFTGCLDDDDYSLGDMWIGFGIIQNANTHQVKLDGGQILLPIAWESHSYGDGIGDKDDLEAGDRVFLNYTILDEKLDDEGEVEAYYVKVNIIDKILLKKFIDITDDIEDSIGSDPIIIQKHWVSNKMLNLQLKYWGYNKTHFINLVKQPGELTPENQPFEFELRHNDNGDQRAVAYVGYVSFKLDSLIFDGVDSVRFKVKSVDYNGNEIIFNEVFKYSENN